MGAKFTAKDLFRLADAHLSDVEFFKFRFFCERAAFSELLGRGAPNEVVPGVKLNADEVNLFEKLFQGLKASRGRGRG